METIINKLYSYISRALSIKAQRLLATFAFGWSLYHCWHFIRFLEANIIRRPRNLQLRYGEGTYALILDCSSSIGKWFCFELAQRSFNLILIADDQGKLKHVINECRKINPRIEIKVLVFDIKKANDEAYYDLLFSHIKDLNISMLIVNNISAIRHRLIRVSSQEIRELLLYDCFSTLFLYRKVIPSMLGRTAHSGIIVVSGFRPWKLEEYSPFAAATRMFRSFLARSLAIEYSSKLDILTVSPFCVEEDDYEEEKVPADEEHMNSFLTDFPVHRIEMDGISRKESGSSMKRRSKMSRDHSVDMTNEFIRNNDDSKMSEKSVVMRERVPFWRRVTARAFVVACLEQLSLEKESHGHWKHDLLELFSNL